MSRTTSAVSPRCRYHSTTAGTSETTTMTTMARSSLSCRTGNACPRKYPSRVTSSTQSAAPTADQVKNLRRSIRLMPATTVM